MLIVIEGTDGAGKNTQAKLVVDHIQRLGREAVLFSFPRYETPIGKAILRHLQGDIGIVDYRYVPAPPAHEDALVFQCMMTFDKYSAVGEILAVMRRGGVVVCDRWKPSAEAYGSSDSLPADWLQTVHASLPDGDINILLDVPLEESVRRRPERRDRYEKDAVKQTIVRSIYRKMWDQPSARWVIVDGVGTVDEVHERIWQQIVKIGFVW